MTDHSSRAEGFLRPQQAPIGFHSFNVDPIDPVDMLPADPVAAQVHATLAVAEQLARIATALERLAGGQEGPKAR